MASSDRHLAHHDLPQQVLLIGVPYDNGASYLKGAAQGPGQIRAALYSPASNLWTEKGLDLGAPHVLGDGGDIVFESPRTAFAAIEQMLLRVLATKALPVALGGDHSITLPVLRAFAQHHPRLQVLHFDAHPDLYDELNGRRYSNASPFARALEENLIAGLVQVGIRTLNGQQRQQAERFKVNVIDMEHIEQAHELTFAGPVYVSFDLDALDPAFAPGVSHHEPGGLTTRQAITILQELEAQVVGADVVELNPMRDPLGITAMAAAKITKELVAKMLESR